MELDETYTNRDYLYGRLLAIADCMEAKANDKIGKTQSSLAIQHTTKFIDRPYTTYGKIFNGLSHELQILSSMGLYDAYEKLNSDVISLFEKGDFEDDSPLDAMYLMGYHNQLRKMRELGL